MRMELSIQTFVVGSRLVQVTLITHEGIGALNVRELAESALRSPNMEIEFGGVKVMVRDLGSNNAKTGAMEADPMCSPCMA